MTGDETAPYHREAGAPELDVLDSLETSPDINIRPFEDVDGKSVADLARRNFEGPSFSLQPKDVVQAYKAANRELDIHHAVRDEGTEAYVAEGPSGDIVGFLLLRSNSGQATRRNAYGDLDLRRLHADPNAQGKGIGRKFFALATRRAEALNAAFITSHASGGSRPFFERHGWTGETILNAMPKRGTSALVFACMIPVGPESVRLFPPASHLVYAGSSELRTSFLRTLAGKDAQFISAPSEEPETDDNVVAAKGKALSVGHLLKGAGIAPVVVANDTRTDILIKDASGYRLENKGKPKTRDEVRDIFRQMCETQKLMRRPVPYVVRTATYIHDPRESTNDLQSEHDVSIWLSGEAIAELASERGFSDYSDQLRSQFGVDVTEMAAGFALPIFLDRGYVAGINGYPLDTLPGRQAIIEDAVHTALIGVDPKLVSVRLGRV